MSELANKAAIAAAKLSEGITSGLIRQAAEDGSDAILIGLSSALPQVMTVGGIMSKAFAGSSPSAVHPGQCCDENGLLLAALLLARAGYPAGPGSCGITISADVFADAISDFAKLKPLVSVASFVHEGVLAMSGMMLAQGDGTELLSGILSKRLPPSPSYGETSQ